MNFKLVAFAVLLWIANVLAESNPIRTKMSSFQDIRGFRQPSISTARGFGKRFSGPSESVPPAYL